MFGHARQERRKLQWRTTSSFRSSQSLANGAQTLDGVLHIGVNANGVEGNGYTRAVERNDHAFSREQCRLLGSFVDAQQRAGYAARNERSVRVVASIGKRLTNDRRPTRPRSGRHLRS